MISRPFCLERIESCWRQAPIVWLSGVRRASKTTLAETLENAECWTDLRPEDCGLLWEHVVLDRLLSDPGEPDVMCWRDKDRHEIDFVLTAGPGAVDAIECKWSADAFDPKNLQVFRALHPDGKNLVIATNVPKPYTHEVGGLTVTFTGLDELAL